MEIVYERWCGLDIHKKRIVACLITRGAKKQRSKEIRTFRTVTSELLALQDWLREAGCTHIAMEATGVYWKPAFNVLEGQFELLVVNAHHIKAVPGRNRMSVMRSGLPTCSSMACSKAASLLLPLNVSCAISPAIARAHVEDRARVVNRLQKVLEDTNVKLGDVATDRLGKSARAMLEAMLAGQTEPAVLADLAPGRLKAKRAELQQALLGAFKPHHRFLLAELLTHSDTLDEAIIRVSHAIAIHMQEAAAVAQEQTDTQALCEQHCDPSSSKPALTWEQAIVLLCTIPGISRRAAEGMLAEIGLHMSRFPSAGHLASWAGLCPGNHQSAGKRLSGKTRKANSWLRKLLVEAAHAAAHTKNTYMSTQYHRLAARRGKKKAMIAVGHSILVIIYHR